MFYWCRQIGLGAAGLLVVQIVNVGVVSAQEVAPPVPFQIGESSEEADGLSVLDEAMRIKVTSKGLRDLNRVIELLETAIDTGLDAEDNDFAERMLSDSLMERATSLMQVINSRSIADPRVQKIRSLVTSDLRDVIAYDDPSPTAYLMLGKLQAMPGGDPREARRAIGNFLKTDEMEDGQRAEALVLRARMVKDRSKAIADMLEAIRLAPENTAYRLTMAIFLRLDNRLDEALAAIQEAKQIAPEDGNAVILEGEIYRQQNRIEEALASFDKATELSPQAPGPYQNRGEIYRQQKDYEGAIAQFNEVLKLQPGVLMTLLHRADAYMANQQLDAALGDIELVLEKQPSLVAAHRLRAEILTRLDRIDEAIDEMERVSAAMPDQVELKMQLALYYLVDKQPSKAIEAYSDVLDQQRDNFSALQSRGDAFLNVGKHGEAIADFTRALKLKPDDTTLLNNLAWVLATSPEDGLRDGKRAVELATKACEMTDYNTPHILSTLAAALAENGDFQGAIERSQQAVSMNDPEHGEQLAKELESYREGQPWRERQSVVDEPKTQPLEESPQLEETPQLDESPIRF
ncbi:MAG: tetratricopeptide repeat protein [Planctomycetota bacterium]